MRLQQILPVCLALFGLAIVLVARVSYRTPDAAAATATGEGIAYDEIVRVLVNVTPPPVGSFQADEQLALNPPTPTPAPRKHGFGLGGIAGGLGSVLSGGPGAAGTAATQAVLNQALGSMIQRSLGIAESALAELTQGHVERHYFTRSRERSEDPKRQTVTLLMCDLHQVVTLDLAKKTYHVVSMNATQALPQTPAQRTQPQPPSAPTGAAPAEQPGTVALDITRQATALGASSIDGIAASGYDATTTITASNATGSCRNGSFSIGEREYVSDISEPRLVCPLPRAQQQHYPQRPEQMVVHGGCKPTFTAHASGPEPPVGRLALYTLLTMHGQGGQTSSGFSLLTERGNVKHLTPADASLFEVPAGFTPQ